LAQLPAAAVSLSCTTVAPPHASLAVGAVKLGVAGHSIVALAAGSARTGLVVSTTVTVRLFRALVFPQSSTACQVTVSEQLLAHLPAAVVSLSCTTVAPPHASLAVGAVKLGVAGHSIVALAAGSARTGLVVSTTVTVLLFCALVFPHASTACQVTVSE